MLKCLLIGGSGGLGRGLVSELKTICSEIYLHGGQDREKLAKFAKELESENCRVRELFIPFKDSEDFLSQLPGDLEPDLLLVSFGPFLYKTIEETSAKDWDFLSLANLALPGALVSRFAPLMAKRGGGSIVLFGGTGTDQIKAYAHQAAYAAAKTGLAVLVKSVAKEFGSARVRCFMLCPGYINTEYYNEDLLKEGKRRMPLGVLQKPEDLGKLVSALLREEFAAVNGSVISCGYGL